MQIYYFSHKSPLLAVAMPKYIVLAESEEIARQNIVKATKIQNIADFLCEIYPAHTVIVI